MLIEPGGTALFAGCRHLPFPATTLRRPVGCLRSRAEWPPPCVGGVAESAAGRNPPEGEDPIEWTLLTTLPIDTPDDVRQVIQYLRLLCGLVLFVSTLYCAPRRSQQAASPGYQRQAGLYPELAALGFIKGCGPARQYTVARIVALSPSIAVARKELARQGIRLDEKAVRRIAEQLGTQMLAWRQRELLAWRVGQLPAGSDFAGRRVAVQIDGGRVRVQDAEACESRNAHARSEPGGPRAAAGRAGWLPAGPARPSSGGGE
ncbi:MAG: hypothetical protein ABSG86_25525 [Thermoguttaceae bacterium]